MHRPPSTQRHHRSILSTAAAATVLLVLVCPALGGKRKKPRPIDTTVAGPADAFGYFGGDSVLSPDGKLLATTIEVQVVAGSDDRTRGQIVLHETKKSRTRLLTTSALDGGPSNGHSRDPAFDADGRRIVFTSSSDDLVDDGTIDENGVSDVFLHDLDTGTTRLLSRSAGTQQSGDSFSFSPQFSPDGRFVAFTSNATDLATEPPHATGSRHNNLYVHEIDTGRTVLASVDASGSGPSNESANGPTLFSGDGRLLLFASSATDLVADVADEEGGQDVFVRDLENGTTELISVTAAGDAAGFGRNTHCNGHAISRDGRYVLFTSRVDGIVASDTNGMSDVFLRDRTLGTTVLISASADGSRAGDGSSHAHSMTPDGRFVLLHSSARNLVPGFTGGGDGEGEEALQTYVFDVPAGTMRLVSHRRREPSAAGRGPAYAYGMSADGRFIVFTSSADDIDRRKKTTLEEVFVYDTRRRRAKAVTRVAKKVVPDPENHYFGAVTISANGRWLAFEADADDISKKDDNGRPDTYVLRAR